MAALVDHSHATLAQLGHLGVALFGQSGLDQILALVVRRRHAARAGCVLKNLASGYEIIIIYGNQVLTKATSLSVGINLGNDMSSRLTLKFQDSNSHGVRSRIASKTALRVQSAFSSSCALDCLSLARSS